MIRWIIFPANGDIRAPDPGSEPAPDAIEGPAQALIGALDPQISQQIRANLAPLGLSAGVWALMSGPHDDIEKRGIELHGSARDAEQRAPSPEEPGARGGEGDLKVRRMGKRDGLLREPKMKRFAVNEAGKKAWPIEALCRVPRVQLIGASWMSAVAKPSKFYSSPLKPQPGPFLVGFEPMPT